MPAKCGAGTLACSFKGTAAGGCYTIYPLRLCEKYLFTAIANSNFVP
jgi:hypothetical protein